MTVVKNRLKFIINYVKIKVITRRCLVTVWKWVKKFQEGRIDVCGEFWSGCTSVITEEIIGHHTGQDFEALSAQNFQIMGVFSQVSGGTLFEIVKNCLSYGKLFARLVLKELTTEHSAKQLMLSLNLLTHYRNESEDFLDRIVTRDETWISYIYPENKQDLMQYKNHFSTSENI